MRIPIARKSSKGRSVPLTAESLVNMYAEEAPGGSKSEIVVHGCPGYQLFSDIASRTGGESLGKSVRGIYRTQQDGALYIVIGDKLVSVDSIGAVAQLGTIAGFGRVGMAGNGVQLCIVAGARGYTYDTTNGLEVITDRDFNGADTVTFIDGFFVFNNRKATQRGQFYISALLDGQTFDALDFATAERYPDNLTRVFSDHSELLLFGEESIEIWFNAGNADFPFARAQGSVIEQGLGARWSVEKVDESVMWLDNEGMVRRLQGLTPVRVSDHAIEHKISKGDWTNATSWSYVQEGHQFYVLTVPAANISQTAGTYVYDAATGLWHERASYDSDYLRMGFYVYAFGKHLVADETKVYEMSLDYYDEAGDSLVSEMTFPQVQNDSRRFIVHKFQLDIEVGVGVIPYTDTTTQYDVDGWTVVAEATPEIFSTTDLYGVGYGDGLYVVVGAGGKLFTSPDALSWTERTSSFSGTLINKVSFSESLSQWVAVGSSGKIATSADGITWTQRTSPFGVSDVSDAVFGGALWVAVGGLKIATSPDGITWTERTAPFSGQAILATSFGDDKFVIIASAGTNITAMSLDGISWAADSLSLPQPGSALYDTAYGGGKFIVSGSQGAGWIATSLSGDGFLSLPALGSRKNANAYGLGVWVSVGHNNSFDISRDNGASWENRSDIFTLTPAIYDAVFGDNLFVVVGANGSLAISQISSLTTSTLREEGSLPDVMLDVSGNTRTYDITQPWRSMGKKGEYDKRVIWRRLGQHRSFTPKIAISAPVKRAIIAAYAEIEPCD